MNRPGAAAGKGKRVPFLVVLWGFIIMFFIAVLAFTYIESKRVNPVILDEKGKPR